MQANLNQKMDKEDKIIRSRKKQYSKNVSCDSTDWPVMVDSPPEYKVYPMRWYVAAVVALSSLTNASMWITFSPIANHVASYYGVQLSDVNWLSLIFIVTFIVIGPFSAWIVDFLGLRMSLISGSSLNALGSVLRLLSTFPVVPLSAKFPIVVLGQTLTGLAQPIVLILPTKVSALWFPPHQRTLATAITSLANQLGILLMSVMSPIILASQPTRMLHVMVFTTAPSVLVCLLAVFGVCSSTPPSPPSASAQYTVKDSFIKEFKKLLKLPMFWILAVGFGVNYGGATAFATLIEQIFCPRGYSDTFLGICNALFNLSGIILAYPTTLFVGKWNHLEEVSKIYCSLCSVFFIVLAQVSIYENISVVIGMLITGAGMFFTALLPLSLELAVESTYPIPEATSSLCLFFMGQIFGMVFIFGMQHMASDISSDSPFSKYDCAKNSTELNKEYMYSNWLLASCIAAACLVFLIFYQSDYKRLNAEKDARHLMYDCSDEIVAHDVQ